MKIRYRKYLLIAILLLIVTLFFLPIKVPFAFRTTAIVYPIKKWSLKADSDGSFVGELVNYRTGVIEDLATYKFERGDIARLRLMPYLENNSFIKKGDTLGFIHSQFLDEKIQQIENSIEVESKLLASGKAGEKETVLENLRQKVINASVNYDFAKTNFERAQTLINDSVIADNDFEIIENQYNNALSNIELAKSEYQVALTGTKPEEISLIEERIKSYQKELLLSQKLKNEYVLAAPFAGKMIFDLYSLSQNPRDYISVTDTSYYVLYAPVKFNYRLYVDRQSIIEFTIPGTDQDMNAKIFEISNNVELISNGVNVASSTQVIFVFAEIIGDSQHIYPGLTVQCQFVCDHISLWEYANRTLNIFIR